MKFKEGDLVEVIKDDYYLGFPLPKGSQWIVYEDQSDDNNLIKVYDYRHISDYSLLWVSHVKKIEPFKPLFKVGDMVKVRSSTYIEDHSIGNIYRVEGVVTDLTRTEGLVQLYTGVNDDYTKTWAYDFNEVELVNDNSYMKLVDIIQDKNLSIKKLEEEPREEKNELLKFFKNLLTGKKD